MEQLTARNEPIKGGASSYPVSSRKNRPGMIVSAPFRPLLLRPVLLYAAPHKYQDAFRKIMII
jgi:hypothetical protein